MAVMATIPVGRPLTIDDFEAIRDAADDGHRYELVDGSLVVTPAPTRVHQRCVGRLYGLLAAGNPDPAGTEVLVAPFDVQLGGLSIVQPDVVVIADDRSVPVLVVEVLSPSTQHLDIGLKWSRYAAAGIPHYWVVDPGVPTLTAWTLEGGVYVESARASGGQQVALTEPWPVTASPAELIRR